MCIVIIFVIMYHGYNACHVVGLARWDMGLITLVVKGKLWNSVTEPTSMHFACQITTPTHTHTYTHTHTHTHTHTNTHTCAHTRMPVLSCLYTVPWGHMSSLFGRSKILFAIVLLHGSVHPRWTCPKPVVAQDILSGMTWFFVAFSSSSSFLASWFHWALRCTCCSCCSAGLVAI